MAFQSTLQIKKLDFFADSCAKINLPNATISYNFYPERSGRYSFNTIADISCNNAGHVLYGENRVYCQSNARGIWSEPVEEFRCIPTEQGE